jgi:hypothetical protein
MAEGPHFKGPFGGAASATQGGHLGGPSSYQLIPDITRE